MPPRAKGPPAACAPPKGGDAIVRARWEGKEVESPRHAAAVVIQRAFNGYRKAKEGLKGSALFPGSDFVVASSLIEYQLPVVSPSALF